MAPAPRPPTDAEALVLADASYVEFSRELARWSGRAGRVVERDGYVLWATGSDFPVTCNGVVRVDPTASAEAVVAAADAWFDDLGRGWSLSCATLDGRDDELARAAGAAGLLEVTSAPAMVCEARLPEAAVPADVDLVWLDHPDQVADFVAVNDAAYQTLGMPGGVVADMVRRPDRLLVPWVRTVVAYVGGAPVATAQVLLGPRVAGVYYVGTVAEARGRGLAALVTTVVTNEGFDHGAALVTLQASTMGEPVYRRLGYRERYRYVTHTRFR